MPDSILSIPAEVLAIAQRLDDAGHDVWCVGGAVRDDLLGIVTNDFDLATSARPDEVQRLFRRTVPVGVEHGTVGVLDRNRVMHEVTTFRRDVTTDGRHAVVDFGASLDEDLARRDFTINAIAFHPLRQVWSDPYHGREDILAKRIRAVGDPVMRFREDYLRILRALRFSSRFGFEIDGPTWTAAVQQADGLHLLSAERVRDEWMRGLEGAQLVSRFVATWGHIGALHRWLPEVSFTGDDFGGEMEPLDRLPRDPVLMTAFLSGDPGTTLDRLRCSRTDIARARQFHANRDLPPKSTAAADVRRWLAQVGNAADDLLAVIDATGGHTVVEAVRRVRDTSPPITMADLAVTGSDILGAGVPRGRAVGRMLEYLLDLVLENPAANDRDILLRAAQDRAAQDISLSPET